MSLRSTSFFSLKLVPTLIFLLFVWQLFSMQMSTSADDPGLGWHLQSGAHTIQTFTIPQYDPFLFSVSPRRWISDQWMGDVMLFSLFDAGGWIALYLVLTGVFILLFLGVSSSIRLASVPSSLCMAIIPFLVVKVIEVHFIVRPVVFGFLFFEALYLLLLFWTNNPSDQSREFTKRILILASLFVLWANIHPSFVLGLILLGALGGFYVFNQQGWVAKRWVIFGFPICILAPLLNPNGVDLYQSVIALGSSPYFMSLHEEWQPPHLSDTETQIALLLVVLLFPVGRRLWHFEYRGIVFVSLLFGWMSASSVRMLPYFALVVAPAAAFGLESQIRRVFHVTPRDFRVPLGTVVATVFSILLWTQATHSLPFFSGPYGPSPSKFPTAAVEWILQNHLIGESHSRVIFAPPSWGGFITWRSNGTFQPVIDDRNTLLGESFYRRFLQSMRSSQDTLRLAEELGASYILLPAATPLAYSIGHDGTALELSRFFVREVFRDPHSVVLRLDRK